MSYVEIFVCFTINNKHDYKQFLPNAPVSDFEEILICFSFLIGYTINLIGFSNLGGKNELNLFSLNFELQIGRSHKQQETSC